jgi:hypothetical protein
LCPKYDFLSHSSGLTVMTHDVRHFTDSLVPMGGKAIVATTVVVLEVREGKAERIATCSKHHLL